MRFLDEVEDDGRDDYEPAEVACNRCGKTGLEWVNCGGSPVRWRLFDGGKLHACKTAATADEFPAL